MSKVTCQKSVVSNTTEKTVGSDFYFDFGLIFWTGTRFTSHTNDSCARKTWFWFVCSFSDFSSSLFLEHFPLLLFFPEDINTSKHVLCEGFLNSPRIGFNDTWSMQCWDQWYLVAVVKQCTGSVAKFFTAHFTHLEYYILHSLLGSRWLASFLQNTFWRWKTSSPLSSPWRWWQSSLQGSLRVASPGCQGRSRPGTTWVFSTNNIHSDDEEFWGRRWYKEFISITTWNRQFKGGYDENANNCKVTSGNNFMIKLFSWKT